MLRTILVLLVLATSAVLPVRADDIRVSLRGSPASMVRQNEIAREEDYTFLRNPSQVRDFVAKGILVPLEGNADYRIADFVSFPFGRPEMRVFVERLSAQYRGGCGERLVVTSLTRPRSAQPANSHALSVHPTGMAVDLRVSRSAACRRWLEDTLLGLEKQKLLDVTRESRPPHYHVAVFPGAYKAHVEALLADSVQAAEAETRLLAERLLPLPPTGAVQHASLAPRVQQAAESDPSGALVLALLALAPLGLALGLRRERTRPDHKAVDELD